MKMADVRVGAFYIVTVSGNRTVVKILRGDTVMGWDGQNLVTNKSIRIAPRQVQRLQREVPADRVNALVEIYSK